MASKKNKGVLVKEEQQVKRDFGYSKDGITLNFTLRVDRKEQLQCFLDLMNAAADDIVDEIKRLDDEAAARKAKKAAEGKK